jgi:hypothetical protein
MSLKSAKPARLAALAVVLLLLLSACGGNGSAETSEITTAITTTAAPATATATKFKAYIENIDVANRTFSADDFIQVLSWDTELREKYHLTDEDFRAQGEDPEYHFLDDYEIVNEDKVLKPYRLADDCTIEALAVFLPDFSGEANTPTDTSVAVSFEDFAKYNGFPCDITLAPDGTVSKIKQYFVP